MSPQNQAFAKLVHYPSSQSIEETKEKITNEVCDYFEYYRVEEQLSLLADLSADLHLNYPSFGKDSFDTDMYHAFLNKLERTNRLIKFISTLSANYKDLLYWEVDEQERAENSAKVEKINNDLAQKKAEIKAMEEKLEKSSQNVIKSQEELAAKLNDWLINSCAEITGKTKEEVEDLLSKNNTLIPPSPIIQVGILEAKE